MIRYCVLHNLGMGHGYILKYFDPCLPTDRFLSQYYSYSHKPELLSDVCRIRDRDSILFEWVERYLTPEMLRLSRLIMMNPAEMYLWKDQWNDQGIMDQPLFGEPIDHRKLLLFGFWHSYGMGWDRRLFMECFPPPTWLRYEQETQE